MNPEKGEDIKNKYIQKEIFRTNLKNSMVIVKREFFYNLKSVRMIVLFIIFSVMLLGVAWGLSTLATTNDIPKLGNDEEQSPNIVLYVLSTPFIWFITPLIAILLSYDSIVTEKLENSLDFLLSRPISRKGIAFGKFLGLLLAFALPVLIVSSVGILIITYVSGESPMFWGCIGFVVFTVIYIGIFILLQLIISTISKNFGTALLIGIVTWLILTLFWLLIPLGIAQVKGIDYDPTVANANTQEYGELTNRIDHFNPSGIYPICVGVLLGEDVSDFVYGVPEYTPFISFILWFLGLIYISMEVFDRKI